MTVNNSTNRYANSNIIVAPTLVEGAMFTTIAAAITYAEANNIYDIGIKPGTYTENFTVSEAINFFGMPGVQNNGNVLIVGKVSQSAAASPTYSNIRFQTNSDVILEFTGTGANQTVFDNCAFFYTDADMMSVNNANANPSFRRCTFHQLADNLDLFNITACSDIQTWFCRSFNTSVSGTNTIASGIFRSFNSSFQSQVFTCSSTATIQFNRTNFQNDINNDVAITTAGTSGSHVVEECFFLSGSAVAVSVGSGTTMSIKSATIDTTASNPITGAGSAIIGQVVFSNTGKGINVTSKTMRSVETGTIALQNTAYAVLCGGTAAGQAVQSVAGLGAAGTVLTSNGVAALPTFQAAGGGGGAWELISTATASDSTTVEFTGLSSSYFMYQVVISNLLPVTDSVTFQMRTSTDNGSSYDSGASDYTWDVISGLLFSATAPVNEVGATDSKIVLTRTSVPCGNAANEESDLIVNIINPSIAKYTKINSSGVTADANVRFIQTSGAAVRLSAADVDAIQFFFSSGNISTGTFKLYGLTAS